MLVLLPLLLLAPAPAAATPGHVMCTMDYRPVCGLKDGRRRTFGTACTARAEGARRIRPGACRGH